MAIAAIKGRGGRARAAAARRPGLGLLPVIALSRFAGAIVAASLVRRLSLRSWSRGWFASSTWLLLDGTESLYVAASMERVDSRRPRRPVGDLRHALERRLVSLDQPGAAACRKPRSGFVAAFGVGIAGYLLSALWTATVFPLLPRVGDLADSDVVIDEAAAVAGEEPRVRAKPGTSVPLC